MIAKPDECGIADQAKNGNECGRAEQGKKETECGKSNENQSVGQAESTESGRAGPDECGSDKLARRGDDCGKFGFERAEPGNKGTECGKVNWAKLGGHLTMPK